MIQKMKMKNRFPVGLFVLGVFYTAINIGVFAILGYIVLHFICKFW